MVFELLETHGHMGIGYKLSWTGSRDRMSGNKNSGEETQTDQRAKED